MFSRNRANPDRPQWFDYEKVFRNLLTTMDSRVCNLVVCFEKQEDYATHFIQKYLSKKPFDVQFIKTPLKRKIFSDEPWSHSLAAASEIVEKDISCGRIADDHLIYILEDDYLHLPFWTPIVLDFFNSTLQKFDDDNDVVCLYDHNDKYLFTVPNEKSHWGMYSELKSKIVASNFRHWRQVPNCGLSMIMSKKTWERDKKMWLDGYSDCEIGNQIVPRYGTRIWTPIPSISTHCVNPFVAPCIDWAKLIEMT